MARYNKYGFNEQGIHIVTNNQFDEYGFNVNRNIHIDTGDSKDKYGYYRRDYENLHEFNKNIFNITNKKWECYSEKLNNLFFKDDELSILINIHKIIHKTYSESFPYKIQLSKYDYLTDYISYAPKCQDGSIDMRYKSSGITVNKTHIDITIEIDINKVITIKNIFYTYYSEDIVKKAINVYNQFLSALKDKDIKILYDAVLKINDSCNKNKKNILNLIAIKQERKSIYDQLVLFKNRFKEEQNNQFNNLKLEIDSIDKEINKIQNFNYEFDSIYEELKIKLDALEIQNCQNKENDEINDLFAKLK